MPNTDVDLIWLTTSPVMRFGKIAFYPQAYDVLNNRGYAILTLAHRFRATNLSRYLIIVSLILPNFTSTCPEFVLNKIMYIMC